MKSQRDLNDDLTTGMLQTIHVGTGENVVEDAAGLTSIGEIIKSVLADRVETNDLEILKFGLCQLLYSTDMLYRAARPDQNTALEPPAGILHRLTYHHHLWRQLLEIKSVLERLEPLCQLFNCTTTHMLETFDKARSAGTTHEKQEMTDIERALQSGEYPWLQIIAQEQQRQTFIRLTERQEIWRQNNRVRLNFSTQFRHLSASIPALDLMDRAFDLLLDSVCSIYGSILPDFQIIAREDDKTVATLLLDLIQKTDLLQQQIDLLQEPLRLLIQQYSRTAEIDRS